MNLRAMLRAGIKNLGATVLGLGVAILLAELILIFVVPPPLRYLTPQARHNPDPDLGWLPVPNARSYTIDRAVETNSLGLRSDEIEQHKAFGSVPKSVENVLA